MVLAGGAGRRIGGEKATRKLGGRTLISYPIAALGAVCERVAVAAKPDTQLPALGEVERWDEPSVLRHPLCGLVSALERAGEAVLVAAADMPFLTHEACRTLVAAAAAGNADAAVAVAAGVMQPVLGVYAPTTLPTLRAAPADAPLTQVVESLRPLRVALPPPLVRSVNTLEELTAAAHELARG